MSPDGSQGIKWNEVTWYSRLLAIILFIGVIPTLFFYIGMQYEAIEGKSTTSPTIQSTASQTLNTSQMGTIALQCANGKSIVATFQGTNVDLILSDGRKFNLSQGAVSSSYPGMSAYYADTKDTIMFSGSIETSFTFSEIATSTFVETYADCSDTSDNGSQKAISQVQQTQPASNADSYTLSIGQMLTFKVAGANDPAIELLSVDVSHQSVTVGIGFFCTFVCAAAPPFQTTTLTLNQPYAGGALNIDLTAITATTATFVITNPSGGIVSTSSTISS
ncbi:MAG TPA: hypothetical protein VMU13_02740 [Candidatus Paceibacterota bacterium]|nr:hypothetical protein [Candidatus Paceibacterota bacterium]